MTAFTGLGLGCTAQQVHDRLADRDRLSAMAGVDGNGSPLPPPADFTIDNGPPVYWSKATNLVFMAGDAERPADIPADIWQDAQDTVLPLDGMLEAVARAILKERIRCANVVESMTLAYEGNEVCRAVNSNLRKAAKEVRGS